LDIVILLIEININQEEFYEAEFQENLAFIFSCFQNVYDITFEHKWIDLMTILVRDGSDLEVFKLFSEQWMDIYHKNDNDYSLFSDLLNQGVQNEHFMISKNV